MAKLIHWGNSIAGVLALALFIAMAVPASAQQGAPVNPTASAVKEQQLLQELGRIQGRGTIPDAKSYVLEQPMGREWRHFHEVTLRWIGAIAVLGILAILVIFYLARGMVKIERGRSGRKIVRFTGFERFVHWMTATCFIILALSGLNITFGKPLLLPLLGPEAFTTWSELAKYAHNYLSFPFTIGVVLIFLMWVGGNIPNRVDVEWIKRGGGIVGNDHPPAYRFNAGQKLIYWIVVIGGGALGGDRLSVAVPVLCDRHRRNAACPDRACGGGNAVHCRHACPHLHRHHRHGRRFRGDGRRHGGRELGERTSPAVAGRRIGAYGPERVAPAADGNARGITR